MWNWTLTNDPCQQPTLPPLHGALLEPLSISTTHNLVPIFGGSKLPMNNDILIPPAAYMSDTFFGGAFSGAGEVAAWENKAPGVVWRGVASGGDKNKDNWTGFHRHRLVAMLNATAVHNAQKNAEAPGQGINFRLPEDKLYHFMNKDQQKWLSENADVGFTDLLCHQHKEVSSCDFTEPYFHHADRIDLTQQLNHKFLPDVDGNSFSGRYLAFLQSTSLPIKSTIYQEWHQDRLVPWMHFVPMDNTFVDLYGILDYFTANDEAAKKIANQGKKWAETVMRKEDMRIYLLRLLLEFGRLCDDDRLQLGFVGDMETLPGVVD